MSTKLSNDNLRISDAMANNQEVDALAHGTNVLCVSLIFFLILVLVVVAYHFLK